MVPMNKGSIPPSDADTTRSFDDLGSLQREIMSAVWQAKETTVQQVRDSLAATDRNLAYTTILSAMQKLEKAGWLKHRAEGRTYVYRSAKSWDHESKNSLRRTLQQFFSGNRTLLLQQLLADHDITDEELADLRQLIQQRKKERDNG